LRSLHDELVVLLAHEGVGWCCHFVFKTLLASASNSL
jgi:hypothetical protein